MTTGGRGLLAGFSVVLLLADGCSSCYICHVHVRAVCLSVILSLSSCSLACSLSR